MTRKRIESFVITSHVLEGAYGRVRIPDTELDRQADQLRRGGLITQAHHDARFPMDIRVIAVEVRPTDDGTKGIWAAFEVDADDWERAGGDDFLRGFSASLTQPVIRVWHPTLEFNADASHFSDEDIERAAEAFGRAFDVAGGRMFQFSAIPPPNVVLHITLDVLGGVAISAIGTALYEGLRHLLRPRAAEKSIITTTFRDSDREVTTRIETNSEAVLKKAVDKLPDIIESSSGRYHEYDSENDEWDGDA